MGICSGLVNQSTNDVHRIFGNDDLSCRGGLLREAIDNYALASRAAAAQQFTKDYSRSVFADCINHDCRYQGKSAVVFIHGVSQGATGLAGVRSAVEGVATREVAVKDAITTILAYAEQQMPKLMVGQLLVEAVNPNHAMTPAKAAKKARDLAQDILSNLKKTPPQGPWDHEKCALLNALINTFESLIEKRFLQGDYQVVTMLNNTLFDLNLLKDKVCK